MDKPKEIENYDCSPYVEMNSLGFSRVRVIQLFSDLFQEIKHGDQEHMDWLENKIKEFVKSNL